MAAAVVLAASGLSLTGCGAVPARGPAAGAPTGAPSRTPARTPAASSAARRPGAARALSLLRTAARAGTDLSYHGVEHVSVSGVGGTVTTVADVWHRSHGATLTRVWASASAPAGPSGSTAGRRDGSTDRQPASADDDLQGPEGVLGVTTRLVALIDANYDIVTAGTAAVGSRTVRVVDVRRRGGALAAQFWLDAASGLPLRRVVFGPKGRVLTADRFVDLTVGAAAGIPPPGTVSAAAASSSWRRVAGPGLARLRRRGWPVPATPPGALTLYEAKQHGSGAGKVVDLAYSDGVDDVSVFLQRGELASTLKGWRPVTLDGRQMYAARSDGQSLTWSGRGFVFTVFAQAPPATVDAVVDRLSNGAPHGLVGRLWRGLRHMATWFDPFR